MALFSKAIPAFFACVFLSGCFSDDIYNVVDPVDVKFATYNLSFDRADFESLLAELSVPVEEQDRLIQAYLAKELEEQPEEKNTAAKIIQIRNVAATIQKVRPDVLMLAEFNNEGNGEDKRALAAFQQNYLSQPQSLEGVGKAKDLAPIEYPFQESYATNTGKLNEFGFDLNNDGTFALPGDAWGFGFYHGQYAFALLSKFEIDTANTRTFQNFKWKDLAGAENPVVPAAKPDTKKGKQQAVRKAWYDEDEWQEMLLSSKNHVDAPILIPTANGTEVVHLLLSHPTPPAFDSGKNVIQNAAEVEFWHQYIQSASYIYDDKGTKGGLASGAHFVIMGDLNLETMGGDGIRETMQALHNDPLVNQEMTQGDFYPTSAGAIEYAILVDPEKYPNAANHPYPNRITSDFGLAVDYALPSASLKLFNSGVFWPASYEKGHALIVDPRIGVGRGKDVNSDHRLVWFSTQF